MAVGLDQDTESLQRTGIPSGGAGTLSDGGFKNCFAGVWVYRPSSTATYALTAAGSIIHFQAGAREVALGFNSAGSALADLNLQITFNSGGGAGTPATFLGHTGASFLDEWVYYFIADNPTDGQIAGYIRLADLSTAVTQVRANDNAGSQYVNTLTFGNVSGNNAVVLGYYAYARAAYDSVDGYNTTDALAYAASSVPGSGMWGFWPLDTNTDNVDDSGNGRDLTFNGTLTTETSPTFLTITSQPADATVNNGVAPVFSITATNATSYQWQDNSSGSFANVSGGTGATTATYTAPAAAYSHQGRLFRCVLNGTTNSNSATLRVAFNLTGTGPRAYSVLGGVIGAGSVESWLRGTDAGGGPTTESRTLTSVGIAAASFQSALTNAQTVASAGIGTFSPSAAAINLRDLASAGVGAANFSSALVYAQPMTSAGVAAATFNAASVLPATMSAAGVGAANFTAQAINAQTVNSAGAATVTLVSVGINEVTFTSAGAATVTISGTDANGGATIESRTVTSAGVGAFSAQSAATVAAQLSSAGIGAFVIQAAQIELRTLTSAGAAAASFAGSDANTPTIEARTVTAAGVAAAQFVGENIGLPSVAGQDGASPYKKWRYYTDDEPQEPPKPLLPPVEVKLDTPSPAPQPQPRKSAGELLQIVQRMAEQRRAITAELTRQESAMRAAVARAVQTRAAAEQAMVASIQAAQAEALEQEIEDDDQEAISLAVSLLDL